jgi:hypothetical protein
VEIITAFGNGHLLHVVNQAAPTGAAAT